MTDPRQVDITVDDLRSLTVRELVQACRVVGVRRAEVAGLVDMAMDPNGDPDETAQAVDLVWALAWQYVRRSDPSATWDDAKGWDVKVTGVPDPVEDDLEQLRAEAALTAGVTPDQVDDITLAQLDAYRVVRSAASGG